MANLNVAIVLALLAFTTIQQNNVCLRNKYIGGPQNAIIKAQELLDSLLQYSNVSTSVLYFGDRTVQSTNGDVSTYYVFKINDVSNTSNPSRLLFLRITTSQQNTFVDEYFYIPAPVTGNNASILSVNALLLSIGITINIGNNNTVADVFANNANAVPCNLTKEYYTHFYQVFGERFKKDLNK